MHSTEENVGPCFSFLCKYTRKAASAPRSGAGRGSIAYTQNDPRAGALPLRPPSSPVQGSLSATGPAGRSMNILEPSSLASKAWWAYLYGEETVPLMGWDFSSLHCSHFRSFTWPGFSSRVMHQMKLAGERLMAQNHGLKMFTLYAGRVWWCSLQHN